MLSRPGVSPLAYRSATAVGVASFLVTSHWWFPDGAERAERQYVLVTGLGYGHLLGALRGARRPGSAAPAWRAFVALTLATGFVLYLEAVSHWPAVAFVLLALPVWHFTENDVALARALRTGGQLGPLPGRPRDHVVPVAAAACVVGVALLVSPDPGRLGDLFAATTLFHLLGWCVFLLGRGTGLAQLLWLHAPPLALGAWLAGGHAEWLGRWLFTPGVYLYWASIHVLHTGWLRRPAGA
ncbi:MAG: hypothetical protein ABFS41_20575 [Myxococcota bacterium]